MRLEKFAQEIKNTTNGLMVTEQKGQITVKAFEEELNDDLEQVTADLQFIDNLEGKRVDSLTIIIKEVE